MNTPDAGRAPSNEPEPVKIYGIEVLPEPTLKLICGNCDYHVKSGPMNYCPQCGVALLAPFRWTLPPSQEARAAAHGITRTRAEDMPAPHGRFERGVYRGWPKPKP